jgi:hypothetical protein
VLIAPVPTVAMPTVAMPMATVPMATVVTVARADRGDADHRYAHPSRADAFQTCSGVLLWFCRCVGRTSGAPAGRLFLNQSSSRDAVPSGSLRNPESCNEPSADHRRPDTQKLAKDGRRRGMEISHGSYQAH